MNIVKITIIFLLTIPSVAIAQPEYYEHLRDQCRSRQSVGCCMASVNAMEKGGYKLASPQTDDSSGCPEGFRISGMRCMDSYAWCVPVDEQMAAGAPSGVKVISLGPAFSPGKGQDSPQQNFSPSDLRPMNEDAFTISAATGGDYLFWAPGEFSSPKGQVFLKTYMAGVLIDDLLRESGKLLDTGEKKTFVFSVNADIEKLFLFASLQSQESIDFYWPDGHRITGEEAGVQFRTTNYMKIAEVQWPAAGEWKVEIHGNGKYMVRVKAFAE